MKSLEGDLCIYWNMACETARFQLSGRNGGKLLDFCKNIHYQQQYRSLSLENNDNVLSGWNKYRWKPKKLKQLKGNKIFVTSRESELLIQDLREQIIMEKINKFHYLTLKNILKRHYKQIKIKMVGWDKIIAQYNRQN